MAISTTCHSDVAQGGDEGALGWLDRPVDRALVSGLPARGWAPGHSCRNPKDG